MSERLQVFATDRDGRVHRLPAAQGAVLMEVLRDAGLGVEAVCGGCCACATCHVYLLEESPYLQPGQRAELETALLSATDNFVESQSRLSCQIQLSTDSNNLRLQIAPED